MFISYIHIIHAYSQHSWKKFKHWLIRKLGGYVAPTQELVISHTYKPLIKLQTTLTIPDHYLDEERIKEILCKDLARSLEPYITIQTCEQYTTNEITYRATIEVAGKEQ